MCACLFIPPASSFLHVLKELRAYFCFVGWFQELLITDVFLGVKNEVRVWAFCSSCFIPVINVRQRLNWRSYQLQRYFSLMGSRSLMNNVHNLY